MIVLHQFLEHHGFRRLQCDPCLGDRAPDRNERRNIATKLHRSCWSWMRSNSVSSGGSTGGGTWMVMARHHVVPVIVAKPRDGKLESA
jgi:hypothetical protein